MFEEVISFDISGLSILTPKDDKQEKKRKIDRPPLVESPGRSLSRPSTKNLKPNPMKRYFDLMSDWENSYLWDLQAMSGRLGLHERFGLARKKDVELAQKLREEMEKMEQRIGRRHRHFDFQKCSKCGEEATDDHINQCAYYTAYHETLHKQVVILVNGSSLSLNGFAGENKPKFFFPTLMGKSKYPPISIEGEPVRKWYAGEEAYNLRGALNL